jgi:hypothetical protein
LLDFFPRGDGTVFISRRLNGAAMVGVVDPMQDNKEWWFSLSSPLTLVDVISTAPLDPFSPTPLLLIASKSPFVRGLVLIQLVKVYSPSTVIWNTTLAAARVRMAASGNVIVISR